VWFPRAAAHGGHWLVLIFDTSGNKHVKEDTAFCDSISYTFVLELKSKFHPKNRPRRPRGGVEIWLYSFFNLGARWRWVVNAMPRPLYPRERPGTHYIGGWVGLRAGLDRCRISCPHRDSIPGPSSP